MTKSYRTSINLDEYTSEIVKKIPNRSEFMRECIRRWYAAQMDKEHIHMTEIEVCWPYSQLGVCSICWPAGILTREDWKYYRAYVKGNGKTESIETWAKSKIEPDKRQKWQIPTNLTKNVSLQVGGKRSSIRFFSRIWAKVQKLRQHQHQQETPHREEERKEA